MPDLNEISGLPELGTHTLGDPRVTIAVMEGPIELERACFQGANLTKIEPYWEEDIEIDPKYIPIYLEVTKKDNKRVDKYEATAISREQAVAKREAELDDIIPAPILDRLSDSIDVQKSPFCRINSDCWDVKLKFFDPENGRRAKKVYRFTIDVSDTIPVTLGEVRSWSTPY